MSGSGTPEAGINWGDLFPGAAADGRAASAPAVTVAEVWENATPETRALYRNAAIMFARFVELWQCAGASGVNSRYMALWSLHNAAEAERGANAAGGAA